MNDQSGESNLNEIVGMASFNFGCGNDGFALVFLRISSYVDWIESVVWPGYNECDSILWSPSVLEEPLLLIAVIKNFFEPLLFVLVLILMLICHPIFFK